MPVQPISHQPTALLADGASSAVLAALVEASRSARAAPPWRQDGRTQTRMVTAGGDGTQRTVWDQSRWGQGSGISVGSEHVGQGSGMSVGSEQVGTGFRGQCDIYNFVHTYVGEQHR